ncbi:MAG: DUF4143 domain-containing protein [Raoultibacter sp.]
MTYGKIKPEGYLPRIVDAAIEHYLALFGAVEVAGTKWCGKTWAARAHAASVTYVDQGKNLQLASADPSLILLGETPHVIDEWQQLPLLWDTVRHAVDNAGGVKGSWILTGSSVPRKEEVSHSGAGRIGRIRMSPMTLAESGDSTAKISLAGLFAREFTPLMLKVDTRKLVDVVCRGGWPEALGMNPMDAQVIAREYLRAVYDQSIPRLGKKGDSAERLVASLARNLGQAVTYKTLQKDMFGEEGLEEGIVSMKTVADYVAALESLYLIESVKGWAPPARSPRRVQTKEKRYFADPSLAAAALGMNTDALLGDWQTFGLLFENLCMRDLGVYARALPNPAINPVRYYRDDSGLEVDAIIELADGRWAALEIKTSEDKVAAGVKSLTRLRDKLQKNPQAHMREPEFLAVVVGIAEYARKTPEGVYVIPITALGA